MPLFCILHSNVALNDRWHSIALLFAHQYLCMRLRTQTYQPSIELSFIANASTHLRCGKSLQTTFRRTATSPFLSVIVVQFARSPTPCPWWTHWSRAFPAGNYPPVGILQSISTSQLFFKIAFCWYQFRVSSNSYVEYCRCTIIRKRVKQLHGFSLLNTSGIAGEFGIL